MPSTLDCPVDFVQVNENRVRLTALWVLVLVITSLIITKAILPVFTFLSVDFFLRAFNFGKYSPLNKLSGEVVKQFNIANKPIDQAPKRFAAGIGFVLSLTAIALLFIGLPKTLFILSLVFGGFAFLESVLSFCAGCYVYTFLLRIKVIK